MNGGESQSQNSAPAGWVFRPGGDAPAPANQTAGTPAPNDKSTIEWTASEYVAHQKQAGWYLALAGVTVLVAGAVYWITRDMISTGFILFAGLVVAVMAGRKPKVIAYRLDEAGLTIGQKYYAYGQFKSFVVMQQGPIPVVMLMPLKRVLPSVDMYIPPENADAILDVLSQHLPVETRNPGLADTLAHRIRF